LSSNFSLLLTSERSKAGELEIWIKKTENRFARPAISMRTRGLQTTKIMKTKIFTIAILLLISITAFAQTAKPRFVHAPDLGKTLAKFLTPQGFLDPKFADATAKPSRYYSDFYGIQALADTTKEGIKRDFVPKLAEVVSEDENTLTLKFKNGFSGKFYPNSSLKVIGIETKWDHVEISGDTWPELLKNLTEFLEILSKNKLEKRYLRVNPYYKDELVVYKQLTKNLPSARIKVAPLTEFQTEKNAVLLYPERVHGILKGYEELKANVLDKQKFDWMAMEMLPSSMQKDVDIYVKSADNSPEYLRTRKVLLDYFKDSWNGRAGPKTSAEENYYFKIVEQMRASKTRLIAMEKAIESQGAEYIFFRYGENKFGGAVRSYWWAKALPKTGKGLVFGGSGHFTGEGSINFQDFQAMLSPKIKMFSLEEIKIRKN